MPLFRVPINLSYTSGGGPGVNVWAVRAVSETNVFTNVDLNNAVSAIRSFYAYLAGNGTVPSSLYPPGTTITLGEVVDRETSESVTPTFATLGPMGTGNTAPPALQMVVSWKTSLRARRGMGRTFLGPLGSGCLATDGTPVPGVVTLINEACTNLLTASEAATGWAVGVWGQQEKLPKDSTPEDRRAAPHVHRDITGFTVKDRFSILRSRRD